VSYSVESINGEANSVKTQQAQQEQILQMQQLKDAKTQENGTKVEDAVAVTATERKTDTVEISTEGQKALEQMKAAKAGGKPAAGAPEIDNTEKSTTSTASAKAEASASKAAVSQLTEEKDSSSASDLYTKTESQLKLFVSKGTITRQEMQTELKRRGKDTENVE